MQDNQIIKRIVNFVQGERQALGVFVLLGVTTVGAALIPAECFRGDMGLPTPATVAPVPPAAPIKGVGSLGVGLTAAMSQTKILRGQDGRVFIDLTIDTPAGGPENVVTQSVKTASDVVVVLDRSGSMAADNRLPYAKEAIHGLLNSLGADDRFGLVTFDTSATITTPLRNVSADERERMWSVVQSISPGASTNIGDGLVTARNMLNGSSSDAGGKARSKRVILLSDGEANIGVTDSSGLGKLASELTTQSAVLSTIGMGLGFNETLMTSLADYGMGNYAYLENLATLGDILTKDLNDSRNTFASRSEIRFKKMNGVEILDAGGYPIESIAGDPSTVRIATGQLLGGSKKHLVLTLRMPTGALGSFQLGGLALNFTAGEQVGEVSLPESQLVMAVLEEQRRAEAVASVNLPLYKQTWETNNIGMLEKDVSNWLRVGDREKAVGAIARYRNDLKNAEGAAGAPIASSKVEAKLRALNETVGDAFSGDDAAQKLKQNRYSKAAQMDSLAAQRAN